MAQAASVPYDLSPEIQLQTEKGSAIPSFKLQQMVMGMVI